MGKRRETEYVYLLNEFNDAVWDSKSSFTCYLFRLFFLFVDIIKLGTRIFIKHQQYPNN